MVHTLAEQNGMIATFMPKPFSHLTGNGCHFHMSLWDGETNLFLDESDPRGLGLSETAYHFIGGLKEHARAYSALTAPTVNSYKRLKLGTTTSGATWSPVWISYGYNNRTQMLRIPGPGPDRGQDDRRLVQPVSRGGRGARGRARRHRERARRGRAERGQPVRASRTTSSKARGLETLPANAACRRRTSSSRTRCLREALGRGRDEDYVDYFIRVKREEWNRYHEQVTPWEIREYLTRF